MLVAVAGDGRTHTHQSMADVQQVCHIHMDMGKKGFEMVSVHTRTHTRTHIDKLNIKWTPSQIRA